MLRGTVPHSESRDSERGRLRALLEATTAIASELSLECERLVREVKDLKDGKRFGLVYERHVGDATAGVGYLIDNLGPSLFGAR